MMNSYMSIHGVIVAQIPDTQKYVFYSPQGLQIALVWLGEDKQLTKDVVTLGYICKALSNRWGIKAK